MKSRYLFAVFFFMLYNNVGFSQNSYYPPIENGPRISISWQQFKAVHTTLKGNGGVDTLTLSPSTSNVNFALGMFMQFNIQEYFFIRPEALVHVSNRKLESLALRDNTTIRYEDRAYALSIPLLLGYRVDGWSVQAGVTWYNQLRNKLKKGNSSSLKYEYGSYITFTTGLGYQKDRWLIDCYYEKAIKKAMDTAQGDVSSLGYSPSHWGLRLGIAIGKR